MTKSNNFLWPGIQEVAMNLEKRNIYFFNNNMSFAYLEC